MIALNQRQFIFRFFPVFFVIYYLVPGRMRTPVMIAGSLIFYATGDPRFVVLLVILSLVNWTLSDDTWRFRTFWAVAAMVMDVSVLAAFKYFSHRYG